MQVFSVQFPIKLLLRNRETEKGKRLRYILCDTMMDTTVNAPKKEKRSRTYTKKLHRLHPMCNTKTPQKSIAHWGQCFTVGGCTLGASGVLYFHPWAILVEPVLLHRVLHRILYRVLHRILQHKLSPDRTLQTRYYTRNERIVRN